jgi:large subunit ribosomal protein L2
VRFHGGGHKRYRVVDFKRRKLDVAGKVERLEYDPNRTAFIALIRYTDNELAYILAPQRLSVGDEVIAGNQVDVKPGNAMPIANIPVGAIVHNVEMKIGTAAPSRGRPHQANRRPRPGYAITDRIGEQRLVHGQFRDARAVSNRSYEHLDRQGGPFRAWLPPAIAASMNPIDHPHGAAKAAPGGRHPVTPWGKPTKGEDRTNKSTDRFTVSSRHNRKKG